MICDLQKASFWKRISAFLFDFLILAVVAVEIALLISIIVGYEDKFDDMKNFYVEYSEKYGIDLNISAEEYNNLPEAEKAKYIEADKALNADADVLRTYDLIFNLTLVIICVSFLLSYLLLEFIIPLFFKNGQTLGKKIFGIGVIRTRGVRVSNIVLFIRMLLGKFTIETMVPVFLIIMLIFGILDSIVGIGVIIALIILELIVIIATHTRSPIHDLLADTVVVDISTQMIFDTDEDMLAYKKKLHAEEAARAKY